VEGRRTYTPPQQCRGSQEGSAGDVTRGWRSAVHRAAEHSRAPPQCTAAKRSRAPPPECVDRRRSAQRSALRRQSVTAQLCRCRRSCAPPQECVGRRQRPTTPWHALMAIRGAPSVRGFTLARALASMSARKVTYRMHRDVTFSARLAARVTRVTRRRSHTCTRCTRRGTCRATHSRAPPKLCVGRCGRASIAVCRAAAAAVQRFTSDTRRRRHARVAECSAPGSRALSCAAAVHRGQGKCSASRSRAQPLRLSRAAARVRGPPAQCPVQCAPPPES
jgi:hypothetical protein